jgi:hypothetical protein
VRAAMSMASHWWLIDCGPGIEPAGINLPFDWKDLKRNSDGREKWTKLELFRPIPSNKSFYAAYSCSSDLPNNNKSSTCRNQNHWDLCLDAIEPRFRRWHARRP